MCNSYSTNWILISITVIHYSVFYLILTISLWMYVYVYVRVRTCRGCTVGYERKMFGRSEGPRRYRHQVTILIYVCVCAYLRSWIGNVRIYFILLFWFFYIIYIIHTNSTLFSHFLLHNFNFSSRLALAETFCLNCGILALDEPTTK